MPSEALWITEAEVAGAVSLPEAIEAVRRVLLAQHAGAATTLEKTAATFAGSSTLHALGGIDEAAGLVGTKTWAHTRGGATPLVTLWDAATGALRAIVEAFALGQLRTAAVSAVATDVMAPPAAERMAIVGTGKQSLPQVAAVAAVRPLRQVRVHSPTPRHRAEFCARLRTAMPAVEVVDAASVGDAVADAPVVTTATRASTPFLDRWHLAADVHVNAIGAITPDRRELEPGLVAAASLVASDSPFAASTLSAELDFADRVVELHEVVASPRPRTGLSLFKAMGLGLADIAVAAAVLDRITAAGGGRPIPAPEKSPPRLFEPRRAAVGAR